MSHDDEPEEWSPEDDKIDDKFKKAMTRYMEKLMSKLDKDDEPTRHPHPGRPHVGEYVAGGFVPMLAAPFVNLKKISNGWILQHTGPQGLVETFATIDGIAQAAHDACVAAEAQYEQSKKILEGFNKGGLSA